MNHSFSSVVRLLSVVFYFHETGDAEKCQYEMLAARKLIRSTEHLCDVICKHPDYALGWHALQPGLACHSFAIRNMQSNRKGIVAQHVGVRVSKLYAGVATKVTSLHQ